MDTFSSIWRDEPAPKGEPLDFSRVALLAPSEVKGEATAEEAARLFMEHLGWAQWVRFYPKTNLALRAAALEAKGRGLSPLISYVAPGSGAPLDPSGGPAGLTVLRADWSPDKVSLSRALAQAKAAGTMVVLDENSTALRLHPDGAGGYFGLRGDMAIYGPSLAAGLDIGILAGVGQAPPEPKKGPEPKALAALALTLERFGKEDDSQKMAGAGAALTSALEYFAEKSQLSKEIGWTGPEGMPRLEGSRLWAFMETAREEGLALAPLIMPDPRFDPSEAAENLWPRLARVFRRMTREDMDERSPKSWPEAMRNVTNRGLETS